MKNVTRRTGRPALFLTGVTLALAAVPLAASAQALDSYLRPGGGRSAAPAGQAAPVQQAAPARPNPSFSRPNWGGNQMQSPYPGLPFRRILSNGNGAEATYSPVIVTEQIQGGYSGAPVQTYGGGNVFSQQYYNGCLNNGGQNNYYPSGGLPPVGPANGFFNNLTPPVGPANGFSGTPAARPTYPRGPQDFAVPVYVSTDPVILSGPTLLGGYYYGNYCDTASSTDSNPTVLSVYSNYSGFPQYIDSPSVTMNGQPDAPVYDAPPQSFAPPSYPETYNPNDNVASPDQARTVLKNAYPADSFQAAFGDVARAWTDGNVTPLRRHVRDSDTRIAVSLNGKYSYSIASGDFVQITRDALTRLHTVSFEFTHIRKAKNGDVTAYGKHVYRPADTSGAPGAATDGDTVPFDQAGIDLPFAPANAAASDVKTVYVSYTLRRQDGRWNVIALDSSDHTLVPADAK